MRPNFGDRARGRESTGQVGAYAGYVQFWAGSSRSQAAPRAIRPGG